MIAPAYLAAKVQWSQDNHARQLAANPALPMAPLPTFKHPREIAAYYQAHGNFYTGDPAFAGIPGVLDFYLHPERLQSCIVRGRADLPIDCDDVALWAAACWRKSGGQAHMITIVDLFIRGTHTLAMGKTPDGRPFIIDTNGYHERDTWTDAAICEEWRRIYARLWYIYVAVYDTPMPFGV